MSPLLEYHEWDAAQKRIGQDITVDGKVGKVLSWDSDKSAWQVLFDDGVRTISHYEYDDNDEDPGGPMGNSTLKQQMAATIAIESSSNKEI
jgi:hypothetical protein